MKKSTLLIIGGIIVIVVTGLIIVLRPSTWSSSNKVVSVVLAKSQEQAFLSLGGFVDEHNPKIVIDLGEDPQEIAKGIQDLAASYGQQVVHMYGPALSDPLHDAFVNVAESYPNTNIHFYFYEDYPEIEVFNTSTVVSISKKLEEETGHLMTKVELPFSKGTLSGKERIIKKVTTDKVLVDGALNFTENRCGTDTACEVVYEFTRF